LIASVQALLREGLRSAFESRPECAAVLEAVNLPQVTRAFEQRAADVLLLDCELVGHVAVKFLQTPPIAGSGIPILILASPSNRVLAKQMLTAGAVGVVWNRSGIQELRTGIREALARRTWRNCRALCPRESTQSIAPPAWGTFTDRQKKVLQGVLQGWANKEIASELWVTEASVKCTMRQLFAKTNTHSRAQLVMMLMEQLPLDELNALGLMP
jgi:DNA-binding NarL/FixJ family response regulator